jgi:hypothetical protein
MVPNFFKIASILNAFTDLPSIKVDWVPSDIVTQSIHDIVTTPSTELYRVYNIVNPQPLPWSALLPMLHTAGMVQPSIRTIPFLDWIRELELYLLGLDAGSEGIASLSSLAVLSYFKVVAADGLKSKVFVTENTSRVSPTFASCPAFNASWMKLYAEIWRKDGFLPTSA